MELVMCGRNIHAARKTRCAPRLACAGRVGETVVGLHCTRLEARDRSRYATTPLTLSVRRSGQ
jgi:hypothetical protein